MSTDSRVAALEHLFAAVLKEARKKGIDVDQLFEQANYSLLGSDGPGGPHQKIAAADYLKDIQRQTSS